MNPYRSAIEQALVLLENPDAIEQARKVLNEALTLPRVLPADYLADLQQDDGLEATLANAADPDAVYFRVDPDTGETDDTPVKLNVGNDLTDADGRHRGYL
ncbi:MAG: hypothetical protein HC828_01485 [Blastochloris sp.]|nr:hypothetical protein [Blastochloris sp.]